MFRVPDNTGKQPNQQGTKQSNILVDFYSDVYIYILICICIYIGIYIYIYIIAFCLVFAQYVVSIC